MSKADGEKIRVTFDAGLTAVGSNAEQHFQIQFQTPTYVPGGVMETVTRVPTSARLADAVDTAPNLSAGTAVDVSVSSGVVTLAQR